MDPISGSGKSQYYNPDKDGGMGIAFVVGLLVLVIIAIIFVALYFTCTTPFGGSDQCKCTNHKGTWKTVDGKDICSCPTTMDSIADKTCADKCKPGYTRDSTTLKCLPIPLNDMPNPNPNPACPATQVMMNGNCVCPDGTEKDTDGLCKKSSIYLTNKFGFVLCPTGFSTAYDPKAYVNDTVCKYKY